VSVTSTDEERDLAIQVLEILWTAYLMRHHTMGAEDPIEAMRRLKVAELLFNDLVLGLCKLRDPDTRSASLHRALRVVRQRGLEPERAVAIKKRIAEYGRSVRNLVDLRNKLIAHRQVGTWWKLEMGTDIGQAIRLAVEITDDMLGEAVSYTVIGLDLRAEVIGRSGAA
jgi:hypothetical protein